MTDDTFEFQGKRWRATTWGLGHLTANEIPPEKPDALEEMDKDIEKAIGQWSDGHPVSASFIRMDTTIARATVNAALKLAEEKINDVNRCHLELHDMCIRRMNQLEARIAALESSNHGFHHAIEGRVAALENVNASHSAFWALSTSAGSRDK